MRLVLPTMAAGMTTAIIDTAEQTGHVTSTALVEATPGLTYRQLDYWARCGYVEPEGEARPGSGLVRTWAPEQADMVRRITRLLGVGFVLQAAIEYARRGVACHELGEDIFLEVGS